MTTKEKMIYVDIYADTTGQYSEDEVFYCNCVSVQIPERIVRLWYEENFGQEEKLYFCGAPFENTFQEEKLYFCGAPFENTFETWLKEVYTCDDTDGLYQFSVEHGYCPVCGRKCDGWIWYE